MEHKLAQEEKKQTDMLEGENHRSMMSSLSIHKRAPSSASTKNVCTRDHDARILPVQRTLTKSDALGVMAPSCQSKLMTESTLEITPGLPKREFS